MQPIKYNEHEWRPFLCLGGAASVPKKLFATGFLDISQTGHSHCGVGLLIGRRFSMQE